MILVDKNIKQRSSEIFKEGYNEANVTSVSYDLHIEGIVEDDTLSVAYSLRPNEVIVIKTKEKIKVPDDLLGRIGEKNSRIRQGLSVVGPHYYPGHETYLYLRVQNITSSVIKVKKGDAIAQLFFEQLSEKPEKTYENQTNASFNHEDEYRGLGNYKSEYENRIEKIDDANKHLDERINNLYANILTIMGLFVAVFSIIMVNFTNISQDKITKEFLIPMNLSLGIVITLFVGLLLIFINKAKNKWFLGIFVLFLAVLMISLLCVL